jgi:hypothetical protein
VGHLVLCVLGGFGEPGHGHAVEDLGERGPLDLGGLAVPRRREVDLARFRIFEVLHQEVAACRKIFFFSRNSRPFVKK